MTFYFAEKAHLIIVVLAVGLMAGCATTSGPHYYWGEYNEVVLSRYVAPAKMTAARQVSLLTQDIQKAEKNLKPVAPGIFAHLGMAYAELGNMGSAHQAFDEEMRRFPESRILIEGMLERAKSSQKSSGGAK